MRGFNGCYTFHDGKYIRDHETYYCMDIRPTIIKQDNDGKWNFMVTDWCGGILMTSDKLIGNWDKGVIISKNTSIKTWWHSNQSIVYLFCLFIFLGFIGLIGLKLIKIFLFDI